MPGLTQIEEYIVEKLTEDIQHLQEWVEELELQAVPSTPQEMRD